MEEKIPGYCTITYKLRLYTAHADYLKLTKGIYNKVILIYYNLLLENLEFLNLNNQQCLRELEKLTIESREGSKPQNYIDMDLPVYFRRAAINHAIGSVRSYISILKKYEESLDKKNEPSRAESFDASPLYYKGMYRNLSNESIELKLWNGEKWCWCSAKISGREFNVEDAMSPTLIIHSKYIMMHIPVKKKVEDVTPVKKRMHYKNIKVLSISFSNYDNFATCIVLDSKGNFVKSKFIKGGNEYKDKTSKILAKIKKDRRVNKKLVEKDHKTYWQKLNNISNLTAHKVSKEIIDFAKESGATVIAITEQTEENEYITKRVGRYSPIYLRHKIIEFLDYKSFKDSILITKVRSNYTANRCYKCRSKIKRIGAQNAICEEGHESNYYFNTAMNIGLMSLKKFGNIR